MKEGGVRNLDLYLLYKNVRPISLKKHDAALTQRVQVPNFCHFWFQKPYPEWFLEPETQDVGDLVRKL